MATRAVYPGSFDPLTVAHVAIAAAAREACRVDVVELALSRDPLGKERRHQTPLEERMAAIEAVGLSRPWMGAVVTEQRHLADIAEGYDILVLGADKWAQLRDPSFYESVDHWPVPTPDHSRGASPRSARAGTTRTKRVSR